MNKSRDYLSRLTLEQRIEIAKKITNNPKKIHGIQQYLYQIGKPNKNGFLRTPSRQFAATLQTVTKNKVRASDFDREALENAQRRSTIQ